jgi:hypothetical protein
MMICDVLCNDYTAFIKRRDLQKYVFLFLLYAGCTIDASIMGNKIS